MNYRHDMTVTSASHSITSLGAIHAAEPPADPLFRISLAECCDSYEGVREMMPRKE